MLGFCEVPAFTMPRVASSVISLLGASAAVHSIFKSADADSHEASLSSIKQCRGEMTLLPLGRAEGCQFG